MMKGLCEKVDFEKINRLQRNYEIFPACIGSRERADLLALVIVILLLSHLVSWDKCGT